MEQIGTFMIVGFIAQMIDGILARGFMVAVGVLLVVLSIRTLYQVLG